MTNEELRIIARQLRRAADLIDMKPECDHPRHCSIGAEHALAVAHGWQASLRSSQEGPTGKGAHSDPTLAAVLKGPDPLALKHAELTAHLRDCFKVAADLTAALVLINGTPGVLASRAGIGHCQQCHRYCDASSDSTRLRAGRCNSCHQAQQREKATA